VFNKLHAHWTVFFGACNYCLFCFFQHLTETGDSASQVRLVFAVMIMSVWMINIIYRYTIYTYYMYRICTYIHAYIKLFKYKLFSLFKHTYVLFYISYISLIQIGEEFCGGKSDILDDSIRKQSVNYFRSYHRVRMDELRMFLENEGWEICPVKPGFTILMLQVVFKSKYWRRRWANFFIDDHPLL